MRDLVKTIGDLIESMSALARQAVTEYTPIVDAIVCTQSPDIRQIEHTLDGLLDFCFDAEMLLLYKKLCRHYYDIEPPPRWSTSDPIARCGIRDRRSSHEPATEARLQEDRGRRARHDRDA